MSYIVDSLLWIYQGIVGDLGNFTSILAQHQYKPSSGQLKSSKHAIHYVKGMLNRGIRLSRKANYQLESFLHLPVLPSKVTPVYDANWGPQYQYIPNPFLPLIELDISK